MIKGGKTKRLGLPALFAIVAAIVVTTALAGAATRGPSSSDNPYVIPVDASVSTVSLLTVGDSVNNDPALPGVPYRMVGIPDGLGAMRSGDNTFTAFMNHELVATQGRVRAHGATGAFVSKWKIDRRTFRVLHGEDLIQQIVLAPGGVYGAPAKGVALGRFCSADLPKQSALYNEDTGRGYPNRLFMDGEEVGPEGRAFAHQLNGTSWELPALGKMAFENVVANPSTGDKTVVMETDDGTGNQVYVHVGQKRNTGNPAERAGLTGGHLYGLKIPGLTAETDATFPASGSRFEMFDLGDPSAMSGAALEAASNVPGVDITHWQRPEDGSWDPKHPRDFYFVTTASITNKSRLWRLHFDNPANPAAGGTIDMLLDGTEGQKMMDNITVDRWGRVLIQEDPGAQDYIARIWGYTIATDTLTPLATHDPALFTPGSPGFITRDEESSGIIPLDGIKGKGWYLFDSQVHSASDPELVERGQLLALFWPVSNSTNDDEDDGDNGDGEH